MNRKLGWGVTLIATVTMTAMVASGDEDGSAPPARGTDAGSAQGRNEAEAPAARVRLDLLSRSREGVPVRDAFAPRNWNPPAVARPAPVKVVAPVAPPPAPAVPSAPNLPFVFLGTLDTHEGAIVYYLAQGERVHVVALGEIIDGTYRLESEQGGVLTLTYLPLMVQQVLRLPRVS